MTSGTITIAAAAWRFGAPGMLLLLVAVPFIVIGLWFGFVRQRRALRLFAGATPQRTRPSTPRALVKTALVALALTGVVLALARPQADPIEEQTRVRGRDIAFLIDVSRSMLSRDVVPDRLDRAKLWIKDLTKTLRGDRVALVAFAGVPVVECPLTLDHGFFNMSLDDLSPASSPRGGTMIGDAIRKTLSEVFEPGAGRYRDIILITDGEDQGSFPVEAAKKVGELGVRIIALGIGSELGAPVPTREGSAQTVEYEGKQVESKLDTSTLAKVTQAAAEARGDPGGGVFLNVGTGTIDLDKVYHDLIASAAQRETQAKASVVYRELFPYFLAIAALCLAVEPMIRIRVRTRQTRAVGERSAAPLAAAAATIACCVMVSGARGQSPAPARQTPGEQHTAAPDSREPSPSNQAPSDTAKPMTPAPQDAAMLYNSGRDLFLAGKYADAADHFRRSDLEAQDSKLSALARYNLGQSLLKQATADPKMDPAQSIPRLREAAEAFRAALAVNPNDQEAARNVEIARRLMKDAQRKQQEQQKQQSGKNGEQSKDKQQQQGNQSQKDQQAQQHQQNADDLNDLAQKQSQAADTSKQAQEQKGEAQKQAKTQQSQSQQNQVNKGTQEEQKKLEQSKSQSQQAQDKLNQAQQEQQQASEALSKGDAKSAEEHQRKAADLLNQAAQAEQNAAEQAKKESEQQKQQQAREQQAKEQQAKQQQAQAAKQAQEQQEPKHDQTAQALLDKERQQREARQQVLRALRGRPQRVDKDW